MQISQSRLINRDSLLPHRRDEGRRIITIITPPVHGFLRNNGNGTVTYEVRGGFIGNDSFTYRVQDDGGALSLRETPGGLVDEATVVAITIQ